MTKAAAAPSTTQSRIAPRRTRLALRSSPHTLPRPSTYVVPGECTLPAACVVPPEAGSNLGSADSIPNPTL